MNILMKLGTLKVQLLMEEQIINLGTSVSLADDGSIIAIGDPDYIFWF